MDKVYNIFLKDKRIGTTKLEFGDPPMGVVFGEISFIVNAEPYDFLKAYSEANKIEFTDYPDDKFISIQEIPDLKVADDKGNEIKGLGNLITSVPESSEISIVGIAYPFYGEEFSHHVKAYHERFK